MRSGNWLVVVDEETSQCLIAGSEQKSRDTVYGARPFQLALRDVIPNMMARPRRRLRPYIYQPLDPALACDFSFLARGCQEMPD